MANEEIGVLKRRYVLFSCEGTAEGVVIQTLYDNDLMVVPRSRVVMDAVWDDRPYTRLRKASAIAGQYFGVDYAVDGAEGLARLGCPHRRRIVSSSRVISASSSLA